MQSVQLIKPFHFIRDQDAADKAVTLSSEKKQHSRADGIRSARHSAVMVRRPTLRNVKVIQKQLHCWSLSHVIYLLTKR